jgi:hypothetical protein
MEAESFARNLVLKRNRKMDTSKKWIILLPSVADSSRTCKEFPVLIGSDDSVLLCILTAFWALSWTMDKIQKAKSTKFSTCMEREISLHYLNEPAIGPILSLSTRVHLIKSWIIMRWGMFWVFALVLAVQERLCSMQWA